MSVVNPIIPGFAPDPSVVKVGEWYFLINSTFHLFPGLPIYASKDLVQWKQIGNAINRPEQLSLELTETIIFPQTGPDKILYATGGIYAPTIRHHDGKFYVICTNVIRATETAKDATQNFITTCTDIWSNQWSDLVYVPGFKGIDPSLYFEDGKVFVCGSAGKGPGTTIDLFEVDVQTGKHLSEQKTVWTGSGGIWPEGPHLFKRKDWYYLLVAEGGTHGGHMVTMARSKDKWGPYDSYPSNPVLTARNTDEYIQFTGHLDAFSDESGQWWGTCLGVRKDKEGRYNMGRETFITPGTWTDDGWLVFERVQSNPTGLSRKAGVSRAPTSDSNLDMLYVRDRVADNYNISEDMKFVTLKASEVDLSAPRKSPTFICKRQRLLEGMSTVTLEDVGNISSSINKAGLAVYKDEMRYLRVYFDPSAQSIEFELVNKGKELTRNETHKLSEAKGKVLFQISYTESQYEIAFKTEKDTGLQVLCQIDLKDMTDPDFVGPVIGPFAVGKEASCPGVHFSGFSVE